MALKNKKSKPPKKSKSPLKLTRKQQRKEKRKDKKIRRNEYFSRKKLEPRAVLKNSEKLNESMKNQENVTVIKNKIKPMVLTEFHNKELTIEQVRKKEKKQQKQIELEMKKQRKKQLLDANLEEDRIIRQMEKHLGLKKKKSKTLSKVFTEDGLDYLLEAVDPEYLKHRVTTEQGFEEVDNDFEEDFALMTDKPVLTKNKLLRKKVKMPKQQKSDNEDDLDGEESDDEESSESELSNQLRKKNKDSKNKPLKKCTQMSKQQQLNSDEDLEEEERDYEESSESEFSDQLRKKNKNKISLQNIKPLKKCTQMFKQELLDSEEDLEDKESDFEVSSESELSNQLRKKNKNKISLQKSKSPKKCTQMSKQQLLVSEEDLEDEESDYEESSESEDKPVKKGMKVAKQQQQLNSYVEDNYGTDEESGDENLSKFEELKKIKESKNGNTESLKRKKKQSKSKNKKLKLMQREELNTDDVENNMDSEGDVNEEDFSNEFNQNEELEPDGELQKGAVKQFPDGTWEDIYGRLRGKDGSVITKKTESKYVPPALRSLNNNQPQDKKRIEKLNRLNKQLKGLLNRLAESNMHSIASQIEELYMNNSRNDMNDTLTNLMMESLVSEVLTPERLLIEHVVLLNVLHANVGTEVGAHFLQHIIKKFDENLHETQEIENKTLGNIVRIISQLYNFKLFNSKLLYQVLGKLSISFEKERDVECILHVLRSVGFGLRKDDPLALKNLILDLQHKATNVSDNNKENSRVKFMLDVLLAIKNNNVSKIPNYDVSYSERLKKIMKGFIRKGNYITELNISLEDLLKADERGRWWVVGSAWTGTDLENKKSEDDSKSEGFSSKLLELARKQRMNTDIRRNIFCIIMSAEDYMDAFEKLLKLGLKNTQEREIISVILHCCLQEKEYNRFYSHLAQKFCDFNRKYQLAIKYSVWDKIKAISEQSASQMSNLAKLLIHLFIEKGLPISTLKVMEFSELDKRTLRFTRQILLGILLHGDVEACLSVFARVSQSEKLKLFRESLRLFIHHFLLRHIKNDKIPEDEKTLIETRAKMVERVLTSKEVRVT